MEQFKDRFAQALIQANMTRAELSRKTGISESLLAHYASGKTTPRKLKLTLIADALHVSPGWLLFGEEAIDFVSQDVLIETYNRLDSEMQKRLVNYAKFLQLTQEEENGTQK